MLKVKPLFLMLFSLFISVSALAADVPEKAAITQYLQTRLPNLTVKSLEPTPIKGLYQLETQSGDFLMVSADGKYLIPGDLHEIGDRGVVNLTEMSRAVERKTALKELKDKDLVVYKANGQEKGEVLVFTDTSCGYCRKFHAEVPELNAMGITVKYAAWPRYGLQSPAGQTMVKVWCSDNREEALTRAKNNETIVPPTGKTCDPHVISNEINLGHRMGVEGTPAVFLANGRQVGGYVPAAQLAAMLGIQPGPLPGPVTQ